MTQEEIISIVKNKGNVGCTHVEHYIDYPEKLGNDWVQIVYFDDERGLAIYLVDDDSEQGEFIFYEDFSHKNEIESFLESI